MGSNSCKLTIWLLLIMASQAHGTETNDNCHTEKHYNDTLLEIKKELSDLRDTMKDELAGIKEAQAYLEKIILTMADSFSSHITKITPLCTDISITESPIITASPTSENTGTPEEFYAAARDGNVAYITNQLEKATNPSSINDLFTWRNEYDDSLTVLHVAAREGHVNVINTMLEAGASPNFKDVRGNTPIHWAAVWGHTAALRALLQPQYQGQVNQQNKMGYSPIHFAAETGHTDAMEVLIANGADIHTYSIAGETPLMWASRWGQVAAVRALINDGARFGDVDHGGQTALHIAAESNRPDVVRLLLQNGADKDQTYHSDKWNRGMTPADTARERGHYELGDLIENWQ